MPDYSKGKIYKIEGGGLTYIGSTIDTLSRRLSGHRTEMKQGKNCSSIQVLCFSDAQITLIELYPCGSVEELKMRERYFYDLIPCVNKIRPWTSAQEYKAESKIRINAYLIANKEKVSATNKAYREANKEKIQSYLEANKEEIKIKRKAYRDANKEKTKAYNKAYGKAYHARKKAEKAETTL